VTLPQGPVPVSGVFPAGVLLHLLETGIQAIQLSPSHTDHPTRRSRRLDTTAGFLACYFPRSPFGSRVSHQIRDISSRPCPLRERYNAAPRGAATTATGLTAPSVRPLPYDHSPTRQPPRSTTYDDTTESADCSTSISRWRDVCRVSGTHKRDTTTDEINYPVDSACRATTRSCRRRWNSRRIGSRSRTGPLGCLAPSWHLARADRQDLAPLGL
jgi:hypothetical protein